MSEISTAIDTSEYVSKRAEEEPAEEVIVGVNICEKGQAEVNVLLQRLAERLQPVLRPERPTEAEKTETVAQAQPVTAPLRGRLDDLSVRQGVTATILEDLLDRLAV